jgi:uncharacterized repeat protein (TIGR03803 family)
MVCAVASLLLAVTAAIGKAAELTSLGSQTPSLDALAYDAISESVLWSFANGPDDGIEPYAGLIADQRGNLYGTTLFGGPNEVGTVFELSPPVGEQTQWSARVLWSFAGGPDDGANPIAGLILDQRGNLYGTTVGGGANCSPFGCGAVFELSPPYGNSTQWRERLLYSFAGGPDDGANPYAGLIADQRGNLYGTTRFGGENDLFGTVFELSPPYGNSSQWREHVLWKFAATIGDGVLPDAGLIADQRGNLYGTTELGGANEESGTVFELSPPSGKSTQWSERLLWSFGATSDDGNQPLAGLLADKLGNLYGTTSFGGVNGGGTAFELSPPFGKSTQWNEQVLWSFGASGDGSSLFAGLLADKWGNLYGTTRFGGANNNDGTVFELSPPYGNSTQWREHMLWNFAGGPDDGANAYAGLLADQWGNLYGTTFSGGVNGGGTVFELSLPGGGQ